MATEPLADAPGLPSRPEFSPLNPKVRCDKVREIKIFRIETDDDDNEELVFVEHNLPAHFGREELAAAHGGGTYRIEWLGDSKRWLGKVPRLKIDAPDRRQDEAPEDEYRESFRIAAPGGATLVIPKASEEMQNMVMAALVKSIAAPAAPAAPAVAPNALELQLIQAQIHRMQTEYDDARRRLLAEVDTYREQIRQLTQQNYDLIRRVAAAENKANAPQSWADEATKIAPLIGGMLDKLVPAKEIAGPAANAAAKVTLG